MAHQLAKKEHIPLFASAALLAAAIGIRIYLARESFCGARFLAVFFGLPCLGVFGASALAAAVHCVIRLRAKRYVLAIAPLASSLLSLAILLSDSPLLEPRHLTDPDVIVLDNAVSPDGRHVAVTYRYDIGALGYSEAVAAVLPADRMDGNLNAYALPRGFKAIGWNPDGALVVRVNILPYVHSREEIEMTSPEAHGVRLSLVKEDFLGTGPPQVVKRERSPDGRRELVAYRYTRSSKNVFIHLSVVPAGEPVPRYGNIYFADYVTDGIYDARWTSQDAIAVSSNSKWSDYAKALFVKQDAVRWEIVVDDRRFAGIDRWPVPAAAPRGAARPAGG